MSTGKANSEQDARLSLRRRLLQASFWLVIVSLPIGIGFAYVAGVRWCYGIAPALIFFTLGWTYEVWQSLVTGFSPTDSVRDIRAVSRAGNACRFYVFLGIRILALGVALGLLGVMASILCRR